MVKMNGNEYRIGDGEPTFIVKYNKAIPLKDLATSTSIALGEAYMDGALEIQGDLYNALDHFLGQTGNFSTDETALKKLIHTSVPKKNQKKEVSSHYDIGNDFYKLWLDETMSYSCGYFKNAGDTLYQAQMNKVDYILKKLYLKEGMTLLDPAAGSGSLLIKATDEAPVDASGDSIVTIFGQEKDTATAGLARMHLILHQKGTGEIAKGNTLVNPAFTTEFGLGQYDFIVMNPPFSDKSWSDGIKLNDDEYKRFDGYGTPPEKNGDYAWFLHVLKSLNADGKAGIVMPHGVLFRGNAEEDIRKAILNKRYIKGIVSLPANLFYGTGIPVCIVIIDKENTDEREGVFIIDASRGFKKDRNKNRLREQDIEKIVRTFTTGEEIPGYSRLVKYTDILENNGGNLNVPRYIQKIDDTLPQNIAAHLKGGIPGTDIESLKRLWDISPELKQEIITCIDTKHDIYNLALPSGEIEGVIGADAKIVAEKAKEAETIFSTWRAAVKDMLLGINADTNPKELIRTIAMMLLKQYEQARLLDNYDVYDCLLNYWNAKVQDRGLLFRLFPRFRFFALFLFRFQCGGILGKGDLFAASRLFFQLVSGRGGRVVDDTVKIIVVLLDSVLDVL